MKYLSSIIILLLSVTFTTKAQFRQLEHEYNFGEVNDTIEELTHTFEFVNISEKPNYIKRVVYSCLCLTSAYSNDTIQQGDTARVTLFLKTRTLHDDFEKPIVVRDAYGDNYYISLLGNKRKELDLESSEQ